MYVYFIKASSDPVTVKIGRSDVPESRIKLLQVGTPFELTLIGSIRCHDRKHVAAAERGLHERLAQYHSYGEWFFYTPEVEQYIADLLAGTAPMPEQPANIHTVATTRRKPSVTQKRPVRQPGRVSRKQRSPLDEAIESGLVLKIPDAAAKYRVDEKRLRGAVFMHNTGPFRTDLPFGDEKLDLVQDDDFLHRWLKKQSKAA